MTGESDPTMTCMIPPLRLSTISESKCADHSMIAEKRSYLVRQSFGIRISLEAMMFK